MGRQFAVKMYYLNSTHISHIFPQICTNYIALPFCAKFLLECYVQRTPIWTSNYLDSCCIRKLY